MSQLLGISTNDYQLLGQHATEIYHANKISEPVSISGGLSLSKIHDLAQLSEATLNTNSKAWKTNFSQSPIHSISIRNTTEIATAQ